MSPAPVTTSPLSAPEAEAIATAVALHYHRAAQAAATSGSASEQESNWSREALLAAVDRRPQRVTAWGLRNWG